MVNRARRRRWIARALVGLAAEGGVLACPICFQGQEGPGTAGIRVAVLVLMGVTACVLGAFARFVVRFAKHDARAARAEAQGWSANADAAGPSGSLPS